MAWADDQVLHVAAAYNNPCRSKTRKRLFDEFRTHMESLPNIRLHVGEIAYGDRPFEVSRPGELQLRTRHELWHKENLLNLVVQTFPQDWKYGAYCDGDFNWSLNGLGIETIHQLQFYDWVQMFSHHTNLGPNNQPIGTGEGFVSAVMKMDPAAKRKKGYQWPGSPGGAWAWRRESFDLCGGLLDTCILGSADYYMARSLTGYLYDAEELAGSGPGNAKSVMRWHERAKAVNQNVGFVDAHATHHFHGPIRNRGYNWRWKILNAHNYDPDTDIYRDGQGLLQLSPGKPEFRDAIRAYFRSRNEDDFTL